MLTADVAIVGGVAGSSATAVLASEGLGVVLIEREVRFRDRVRGESIHPWGVTELAALDLDERQSAARRWVGAETIHEPVHHLVGGCRLDGVQLADDTFHLAAFEGGNILVFPHGGGRARAYLLAKEPIVGSLRGPTHAADFIALCAAAFPEGSFSAAHPAGPLAFFPHADTWSDRLNDDRVVIIGDAAGANDPSGGHGLSLCFRDVRELRNQLLNYSDWGAAIAAYAVRRSLYYSVLRAYMQWMVPLYNGVGPKADAGRERRERRERAGQADPTLGGFALLLAYVPDGLTADDAARRHVLGDDLD